MPACPWCSRSTNWAPTPSNGALSSLDGDVQVRGEVPQAKDAPVQQLVLHWVERGGPPVSKPTRKGSSSRLIAPQGGIDAADLDFRPEGLTCRIVVSDAGFTAAGGG